MPKVLSVGVYNPPNEVSQESTSQFVKELFQEKYHEINRLLKVFENGEIEKRYFCEDLEWYSRNHSFEEKNNTYIEKSVEYGARAIRNCLENRTFLKKDILIEDIDAFFFISSTGISTPSIEARIMNKMDFSPHTKRIPIWGLGCAGGASGLARAFEYCTAFPKEKVLVLAIELCSLTFQKGDLSKSNLIGTSLFADGVSCVCVIGDQVDISNETNVNYLPHYLSSRSTLMKDSEEVMGWNIKNNGLFVVFSKDIPSIVRSWLKDNVESFLAIHQLAISNISYFIAHPGGKKVLDAYEASLGLSESMTDLPRKVLKHQGNMSSATVLYVLKEFMEKKQSEEGEFGLLTALGPGFSSELILLQWR